MVTGETGRWLWQIPLTVLACVAGSLVIVWVVSSVAGFATDASIVAILSAITSAAAIAVEVRSKGKSAGSPAA